MNIDLTDTDLPPLLVSAIQDTFLPAGLQLTGTPQREAESAEYGAARLWLDGLPVVFRVARITPIKVGQFVTLWKRLPGGGPIPLDRDDDIAFVVVSVSDAARQGQFIFDRDILIAKGAMSVEGAGGKCAMRVYPPWVKPSAKQAIKTQQWQVHYFVESGQALEGEQVRHLLKRQ